MTTYTIIVRTAASRDWTDDAEGIRRLRFLLKRLARAYGMTVVSISTKHAENAVGVAQEANTSEPGKDTNTARSAPNVPPSYHF